MQNVKTNGIVKGGLMLLPAPDGIFQPMPGSSKWIYI